MCIFYGVRSVIKCVLGSFEEIYGYNANYAESVGVCHNCKSYDQKLKKKKHLKINLDKP